MSYSEQFSKNGLVSQTSQAGATSQVDQNHAVLNNTVSFEALVPNHVSGNKRAIIEKLIARYMLEAV